MISPLSSASSSQKEAIAVQVTVDELNVNIARNVLEGFQMTSHGRST
jgi:hypothetical protein